MKIILYIAIACLSAGCSSVQLSETAPDYSGIKNVPQQQRAAYYDKLKISEISGSDVRIGSNWYGLHLLKQIYKENGDTEARHMANAALGRDIALNVAPPVSFGLAAFLGIYCGALATGLSAQQVTSNHNGTSTVAYGNGNTAYIYQGAIVGVVVGAALAGIEYVVLHKSMVKCFNDSAGIFNRHLWQNLNLVTGPQPGGVKAGVGQSF